MLTASGSDKRCTSHTGICSSQASLKIELYSGGCNTRSVERGAWGCSCLRIAGRSCIGLCAAGTTTAHTSIPASNKACSGGCEKFPCIPRNMTRGGRMVRPVFDMVHCYLVVFITEYIVIPTRSFHHATNGKVCQIWP